APGADRRARSDRLGARTGARLGAPAPGHRDGGAPRGAGPGVLRRRSRLPDRLGAFGAGFPVALPRRSRPDAPPPPRPGVRPMALRIPPGDPEGRRRRVARPRGRERPDRSEAGTPRRVEPEPRLDAR